MVRDTLVLQLPITTSHSNIHAGGDVEQQQQQQHQQQQQQQQQQEGVKESQEKWRPKKWWLLRASCYAFFILSGQTVATLLGRLYYEKGGKSKWMSSLIQVAGIPILIPLLIISRTHRRPAPPPAQPTSVPAMAATYIGLGLLLALLCMLFSIGLEYLPVSTVALVSASQLGFTALFSFFINSQKMTPAIVNSVVILTTSSVLLVFHGGGGEGAAGRRSYSESREKYALGFGSTLASAAGYAFSLAMTQWGFRRVVKRDDLGALLEMVVYPGVVATVVSVAGLMGSGEWRGLRGEMEGFELGRSSYVMTLVWTAVGWQVCTVGAMGFILEVSSLFSIVVGTLGVPVVPVLAAVYFGEEMNGAKVVSMVLALWGFVSFVYQQHLDGFSLRRSVTNSRDEGASSPPA